MTSAATASTSGTAKAGSRSGGYVITVAFGLVADARERFIALVQANAAASVAEEPGCRRFDVLLPAGKNAPDVLLYEIYDDRAAFDHHLTTAHFKAFDKATADLVATKVVTVYSVTENAKA